MPPPLHGDLSVVKKPDVNCLGFKDGATYVAGQHRAPTMRLVHQQFAAMGMAIAVVRLTWIN